MGLIEHSDKGAYIEVEKLYIDKDKQKQGHGTKAIAHLANKYGKEIKLYPLEAAPFLNMGVKRMDGEMLVLDTDKYNSSKVVNEEGKPLVVYHGTRGDFNTFEPGHATRPFAPVRKVLSSSLWNWRNIMPIFLSISNPKIKDYNGKHWAEGDVDLEKDVEKAKEEGFNGYIAKNIKDGYTISNQYIAFEPTQIKAIGNIGTFDAANDDIRYRETDRPQFSSIENVSVLLIITIKRK